jgi:hypothetical protein
MHVTLVKISRRTSSALRCVEYRSCAQPCCDPSRPTTCVQLWRRSSRRPKPATWRPPVKCWIERLVSRSRWTCCRGLRRLSNDCPRGNAMSIESRIRRLESVVEAEVLQSQAVILIYGPNEPRPNRIAAVPCGPSSTCRFPPRITSLMM